MNIVAIYQQTWLWSSFAFCVFAFLKYVNSRGDSLLHSRSSATVPAILYCAVFALAIGFRPMDQAQWADSYIYSHSYYLAMGDKTLSTELVVNTGSEWLWAFIMKSFAAARAPIAWWFTCISVCYIGFMFWGISRMMPKNQWIALLFCITSFSFFTFSYNGLRNGMACSIVILALSFYLDFNKKGLIIGLFFSFLALGIHRSTALPSLCALVSYFTHLKPRLTIAWWFFSVILSLLIGGSLQSFFASLGFDDRMASYAGQALDEDSGKARMFSHVGFRWDFALYSFMPILLGYYTFIKKRIVNRGYAFLFNTYVLANSFWVMVIRAAFSNRFAYLSWFMYPIVFAYPLLCVKIWPDQDRKTVTILMAYVGFTLFLNLILW